MRFLVHEQSYEQPLASGRYLYDQSGSIGSETWRLTALPDKTRILHIDVDLRPSSGDAWLYHLLLDEVGRPQHLHYRRFGMSSALRGRLLFDGGTVLHVLERGDEKLEKEVVWGDSHLLLLPCISALGFFWASFVSVDSAETYHLSGGVWENSSTPFASTTISHHQSGGNSPLTLGWNSWQHQITFDEHNQVQTLTRNDNFSARLTRAIRY